VTDAEYARKLASYADPTTWGAELKVIRSKYGDQFCDAVILLAKRAWLKRMCQSPSFLIHPSVKDEIQSQKYFPKEYQKKLIWAAIFAGCLKDRSDLNIQKLSNKLCVKYGNVWWKDVEEKYKYIIKIKSENYRTPHIESNAVSVFLQNTLMGKSYLVDKKYEYLKLLPLF
jgi:hypothetical protein